MGRFKEADLGQISTKTHSLYKFFLNLEANSFKDVISFEDFFKALPKTGKSKELLEFGVELLKAKKSNRTILFMCGGHVVKTGCSPVLIDLMKEGFITHIASNGSFAIHDVELSLSGRTSEDVESLLSKGVFGMNKEVCDFINYAAVVAEKENLGYGEAIGKLLIEKDPPFLHRSVVAWSYKLNIPYTVHIGLGTDINHQFPSAKGGAIGEASLRDFRILVNSLKKLHNGGIVVNIGSAVIMPEVFLKAINVARNIYKEINSFTTASFDIITHYRPLHNVVKRPVSGSGKGFYFIGYHEIMLPLLAILVLKVLS